MSVWLRNAVRNVGVCVVVAGLARLRERDHLIVAAGHKTTCATDLTPKLWSCTCSWCVITSDRNLSCDSELYI